MYSTRCYWRCEWEFEYHNYFLGQAIFVGWKYIEVHALPKDVYATSYLGLPTSWAEFKRNGMLTMPIP